MISSFNFYIRLHLYVTSEMKQGMMCTVEVKVHELICRNTLRMALVDRTHLKLNKNVINVDGFFIHLVKTISQHSDCMTKMKCILNVFFPILF
jgi:hypothetical protein